MAKRMAKRMVKQMVQRSGHTPLKSSLLMAGILLAAIAAETNLLSQAAHGASLTKTPLIFESNHHVPRGGPT